MHQHLRMPTNVIMKCASCSEPPRWVNSRCINYIYKYLIYFVSIALQEINRSNRRIMKQTFVSDVLEIPDKIESAATPKVNAVAAAATTIPTTHPADSTTEDDDEENEDDWENMFDESGDCLDPKILQELTDSVGKCKIELPKMDYSVSNAFCILSLMEC